MEGGGDGHEHEYGKRIVSGTFGFEHQCVCGLYIVGVSVGMRAGAAFLGSRDGRVRQPSRVHVDAQPARVQLAQSTLHAKHKAWAPTATRSSHLQGDMEAVTVAGCARLLQSATPAAAAHLGDTASEQKAEHVQRIITRQKKSTSASVRYIGHGSRSGKAPGADHVGSILPGDTLSLSHKRRPLSTREPETSRAKFWQSPCGLRD